MKITRGVLVGCGAALAAFVVLLTAPPRPSFPLTGSYLIYRGVVVCTCAGVLACVIRYASARFARWIAAGLALARVAWVLPFWLSSLRAIYTTASASTELYVSRRNPDLVTMSFSREAVIVSLSLGIEVLVLAAAVFVGWRSGTRSSPRHVLAADGAAVTR